MYPKNVKSTSEGNDDFKEISFGSQLSFQDLSVIRLAHESQSLLLTHVRLVRLEAKRQGLSARTIVWVLDELLREGHLSESKACCCLTGFMNANRRMIDSDCHNRLKTLGLIL